MTTPRSFNGWNTSAWPEVGQIVLKSGNVPVIFCKSGFYYLNDIGAGEGILLAHANSKSRYEMI